MDPLHPAEPLVQRDEDADDHDLLTWSEVGARVSENLVAEQKLLTDLQARSDRGEDVQGDLVRAHDRIRALREVQRRSRPSADALRAFLEYDPSRAGRAGA